MFFAQRQRNLYPDNPEYHTFGEICKDSDGIVMHSGKPEQFDEFGNVKGNFLFLDVQRIATVRPGWQYDRYGWQCSGQDSGT